MEAEYDDDVMSSGSGEEEDEAAAAYAAITSQLAQWGGDGDDDYDDEGGGDGNSYGLLPPTTPFGAKTPGRRPGSAAGFGTVDTPMPEGSPSDHPFGSGGGGAGGGGGDREPPGARLRARIDDPFAALGRRTPGTAGAARGRGAVATTTPAAAGETPGARLRARIATPFGRPAGTPGGYYSAGRGGGVGVSTPFPDGSPGDHPFYGDSPLGDDDYGEGGGEDEENDEMEAEDEGSGGDAGYAPRTTAVRWGTPSTTTAAAATATPSSTRAAPGSAARTTPGFGLLKNTSASGGFATPAGGYEGMPVQTPGSAVSAVRRAVTAGAPAPGTEAAAPAADREGAMTTGRDVEEGGEEYDPTPLYDPLDNTDRPYLPYLSRLLSYLDARSRLGRREDLIREEEEVGEERDDERARLARRGEEAELALLGGFAEACRDRSNRLDGVEDSIGGAGSNGGAGAGAGADEEDFAAEECDLWNLLSTLRSLGMDSLLYSPADSSTAELAEYKRNLADKIEWSPAKVARALLNGYSNDDGTSVEPPMALLRRAALLRWIEGCHSRRLEDSGGVQPPNGRTMWADTVRALKSGRAEGRKVMAFHLDAPLLASAAAGGAAADGLFGNDDANDARLLRSALDLIRAGDSEGAKDLARSAGQGWRAASWSGGEPYGTRADKGDDAEEAEDAMIGAGEEKKSDDAPTMTGNPSRALWQCATRKLGRSLASSSPADTSSVGLESAIASLLSDDLLTSLSNPHHRSYLSSLHLLLRSLANRSLDETLHLHSENRRNAGRRYPYPGTRYGEEEREHLNATAAAASMDEGGAFDELMERSEYDEIREEAETALRRGLAGFAIGMEGAREFLGGCAEAVLEADDDAADADAAQEGAEDGPAAGEGETDRLRRFLVHLLLYLDDAAPDFADSVTVTVAEDEGEGEGTVTPARDAVLLCYVRHLTHPARRALWHVSTPYASLLRPAGLLVEAQSSFVARVNDVNFRGAVMEQMADHVDPGLELLILRRAVRMVLDGKDGEWEGRDDGYPLTSLLDSAARKSRKKGRRPEDAVTPEDVRRMHAARWLLCSPRASHLPDGVVFANALLRRFLLEDSAAIATSAGAKGGKKKKDGERGLDLARVFLSRFVPPDAVSSMMEYYSSEEYGAGEGAGGGGGEVGGNPPVPSFDEAEDAASEHGALRAYVAARDACEAWRYVAGRTSPVSPLGQGSAGTAIGARSGRDEVEDRIASKMERREYLRRKAESGRVVAEAASEARERLTEVLEYGGGWLAVDKSGVDEGEESPTEEEDVALLYGGDPSLAAEERSLNASHRLLRSDEAKSLRSAVLPLCSFLLHSVLDGTGRWMERFEDDAEAKLGEGAGKGLIRGLLVDNDDDDDGDGGMEGGDDNEEADERRHRETPLTPEYWHRAAVGAAAAVATDVSSAEEEEYADGGGDGGEEEKGPFRADDRRRLLEAAAESAVRLLVRVRG